MNSMHMLNREFENGWGINIKHNPDGFGDVYSTNYPYSVMTFNREHGFTEFRNMQYASDVFHYMAEVMDW